MIRARPVTFAGGLLLEDAPEEQKETLKKRKKKEKEGEEEREGGREMYPETGQGGKKVEVMIKS